MGNRYSVARDEEEETQFVQLLHAVEVAQGRQTRHAYDGAHLGSFNPLTGVFQSSPRQTTRRMIPHHLAVSQLPPRDSLLLASADALHVYEQSETEDAETESSPSDAAIVFSSASDQVLMRSAFRNALRKPDFQENISPRGSAVSRRSPSSEGRSRTRTPTAPSRPNSAAYAFGTPSLSPSQRGCVASRSPSPILVRPLSFPERPYSCNRSPPEGILAESTELQALESRLQELERALIWKDTRYGAHGGKQDDVRVAEVEVDNALYNSASPRSAASEKIVPYSSRPAAVGLLSARDCEKDWKPVWTIFPLKAFGGRDYKILRISAGWDDETLLRELRRAYDELRTVWRKWFTLRSVGSMTMVLADHSFVYPQRVGPAAVSPSKNMRLRWFLHHPEHMKGRHEFMQVLTARTDLGIEFVERWQLSRIAVAILLPVFLSLVIGVVYSGVARDPATAFPIAGYVTSAYSVCLVLEGLLNLVDF